MYDSAKICYILPSLYSPYIFRTSGDQPPQSPSTNKTGSARRPGRPPRLASSRKRNGSFPGRCWTKRSRFGSRPLSERQRISSGRRAGRWQQQKTPPQRRKVRAAAAYVTALDNDHDGLAETVLALLGVA